MVRIIFGIVRGLLGFIGVSWVLIALYGIVETVAGGAWGPAASCVLMGLLGFCLAYCAFVRAPWESPHAPPSS
jgi:hypothetical protein